MKNLNIITIVLVVLFYGKAIGQKTIHGKWISNVNFAKEFMELNINLSDSSYEEILKLSDSKKVVSIYKCKFRLIDTNTIVLINGEKQLYRYYFLSKNNLKFFFKDKKLRKSIPIAYEFTFRRKE